MMSQGKPGPNFRVAATCRGQTLTLTVTAPDSRTAVARARQQAREQGMGRIMVRRVDPVPRTAIRHAAEYGPASTHLGAPGPPGPPDAGAASITPDLTLDEIRGMIGEMWDRMISFTPRDETSPLTAAEIDGRIFLDDGASPRAELAERSRLELMLTLYDWAVYTGWTSNDLDAFLDECWDSE